MRRSAMPPRAAKPDGAALPTPAAPPQRKVFHCIVDDTALIAGVKKSTRDGIRKWIAQAAIRLYVPLHTLTQLHRLTNGTERINADAREAVKWLDEATSLPAVDEADRVQLEGVDEAYTTWEHVEHFLLPETLLSMEDSESDGDDYHEDLESSFNALDMSDGTSMSSAHSYEDVPKPPDSPRSCMAKSFESGEGALGEDRLAARHARNSADMDRSQPSSIKGAVPLYLRPLFNHILWRINKETNPDAALESFLLLTNDPAKQMIAQKFGVRAKRLEQLRDAVAREDREYKNHMTMHKLEVESSATKEHLSSAPNMAERPRSSPATESKPQENSDDEDVVLFSRVPRGPAAATANKQRVFDPNDFARTTPNNSPRGSRGGRGGAHIPPRGRGGPPAFRGRGNFAPRGGAYVPPGPVFRAPPTPRHDPNQPLDPDSFTRPIPKTSPVRGGGRRKLWEPN